MGSIRWAIAISYNGNSACKLFEAYAEGLVSGAVLDCLLFEQEDSDAVRCAREHGTPAINIARSAFSSDEAQQLRILEILREREVDFLILLGFDKIIGGALLEAYYNRIVNVHASLLPSFKGRRPIERAIEYGCKVTGITTHFIDDKIDRGIILFQEPVLLKEGDTIEKLHPVFMEVGKKLMVQTINALSARKIEEQNIRKVAGL